MTTKAKTDLDNKVNLSIAECNDSERDLNRAQLKKVDADTRKANAEARGAEITISVNERVAEDRLRELSWRQANDTDSGYFIFDDQVDPHSVSSLLTQLRTYSRLKPGAPIFIELNTPGGHIIEGFRLFDELVRFRGQGHHVTIRVRGQAASMGGVLLQAADKRECGPSAFIMIHRAGFGAMGKAFEIEDEVEFVKTKLEARIVNIFADRSGKDRQKFLDVFDKRKDMWYTAEEALAAGLIDAIN